MIGQHPAPGHPAPPSAITPTEDHPPRSIATTDCDQEFLPDKKGGPSFVTIRYTVFSEEKVISRYPLTDKGWASAWHELMGLDPVMGGKVRAELARRVEKDRLNAERRDLDAATLGYLPAMLFLGGYLPEAELSPGKMYDVRFLADRLAVLSCGSPRAMGQLSYREVEKIDIGGPGLVKSGGGFVGGGFGALGAAEGMAIAAILNAATAQTKIKTVVQIQAASAELFDLHTMTEPHALRIQLSRALGAIREARASQANAAQREGSPGAASVVNELAKLASMLDSGLLTREEFDHLKGKLIAGL